MGRLCVTDQDPCWSIQKLQGFCTWDFAVLRWVCFRLRLAAQRATLELSRPTRKKNGNREYHTDPGAPSALHRFQAHRLRRLPPVWFAYHDFGWPVLPLPLSWVSKRHVGSNCLVGSSDSYVRKKRASKAGPSLGRNTCVMFNPVNDPFQKLLIQSLKNS